MILPIFPILLFYNCSVLLSDFTQMAVVTSLRLYDSQIFEGRGSWGILYLQRAFFLRSLYDLKNEEYRNRKTKETEKNKLYEIETTGQESENRKNRRVVKRNSRIERTVHVELELNYGSQLLLYFLPFSDLALIAPFCQTIQAS